MILERWAENLASAQAPAEIADLHIRDTLAASFRGLMTADGTSIAEVYAARSQTSDSVTGGIAAIARLSECDDIHLASCVTPGAAVVPVALMLARDNPSLLLRAIAAGYAAGVMLGRAIGASKALSAGIWPSLLAAPVMAAVAASVAHSITPKEMARAMASALDISDGRPTGRPQPYRRWSLFGGAVTAGISRPDIVLEGYAEGRTPDLGLLTESWLRKMAGHDAVDMRVFEGPVPALSETGFKPFPIARQALNAVAAFGRLLDHGLAPEEIESVEVFVPAQNLALLQRPVENNRLTRLCNIGFQLACMALAPEALDDPERAATPELLAFAARVNARADDTLNVHLPDRWPARIEVKAGGRHFVETAIESDFDADSPHLTEALAEKWEGLVPGMDIASRPLSELWQDVQRRVRMMAEQDR